MGSPPPSWQFACAAYIPLLTGHLSVVGSSLIIWSVLAKAKSQRKPHHRFLLMMSAYDLQYSLAKAWTFLLAPKGYGVPGAQGNMRTCRLQGFCIELTHATGAYSACLSLYYYLVICRGVKPETFERCVEPLIHVLISAIFWAFAITGVVIKLFNPAFGFCFIASYPPGCGTPGGPLCDRFPPETLGLLYEVFAQMWVQGYFLVIMYTQVAIWWKVREQERVTQKYIMAVEDSRRRTAKLSPSSAGVLIDTNGGGGIVYRCDPVSPDQREEVRRRRAKTRREKTVATQSALYCFAFVVCWLGPTCFHLADWIGGYKAFWAVMVIVIFTPLQGFWNLLVYVRPTYLRLRKKHRYLTRWQCVRCALLGTAGVVRPTSNELSSGQQRTACDGVDPKECEGQECGDDEGDSSERRDPRSETKTSRRRSTVIDAIAKTAANIGATLGDLGNDSCSDDDSWSENDHNDAAPQ